MFTIFLAIIAGKYGQEVTLLYFGTFIIEVCMWSAIAKVFSWPEF